MAQPLQGRLRHVPVRGVGQLVQLCSEPLAASRVMREQHRDHRVDPPVPAAVRPQPDEQVTDRPELPSRRPDHPVLQHDHHGRTGGIGELRRRLPARRDLHRTLRRRLRCRGRWWIRYARTPVPALAQRRKRPRQAFLVTSNLSAGLRQRGSARSASGGAGLGRSAGGSGWICPWWDTLTGLPARPDTCAVDEAPGATATVAAVEVTPRQSGRDLLIFCRVSGAGQRICGRPP